MLTLLNHILKLMFSRDKQTFKNDVLIQIFTFIHLKNILNEARV